MSTSALLYAYRDREAILERANDSDDGDGEYEEPLTHWQGFHFPKLWRELGAVSSPKREETGIAGAVNCVTGDPEFLEALADVNSSIDSWCRLDGLPVSFERLASLIEEDPCELEIPLRRAIASCVLRPRPFLAKEQDAAWPSVAHRRSEYIAIFKEELQELVAILRELQSKGETHVQLTIA